MLKFVLLVSWAMQHRLIQLCCIAHKIKNAVRTVTSKMVETGISSKSENQPLKIPLGQINSVR